MKSLKVISEGICGEITTEHSVWDCEYQDRLILASLQGVLNAGHVIKSFEIVEV